MGFWNKLGKIALVAAPYVAAPFTGGASLAFTGAANSAVKKWNEHDANEAMKKGLAPSNFDKYLGFAGDAAGLAGGMGAFSKIGSGNVMSSANFQGNNPKLSGWQSTLGKVGNAASAFSNPNQGGFSINIGGSNGGYSGQPQMNGSYRPNSPGISRFERSAQRQLGPVMGNMDQSNPNLAYALASGRMDAIQNQPFRSGYDVYSQGDDGQEFVSRMPTISPFQRRQQQFSYTPPGMSRTAPVDDMGEAPEEDMGVEERRRRGM